MGRKQTPVALSDAEIEAKAAAGATDAELATLAGISERTLQRRYGALLKKARQKMRVSIRQKQFELAMSGNVTMLIWLGKVYLGQTETQPDTQRIIRVIEDGALSHTDI